MIELEQNEDRPLVSPPMTVAELNELLEPYYGRVVRIFSAYDRMTSIGGYSAREKGMERALGKLVGINHRRMTTNQLSKSNTREILKLVLEGQEPLQLYRGYSTVEVLEESTGRWLRVYWGSRVEEQADSKGDSK